jgi:heterodisulfide reductase subunit D
VRNISEIEKVSKSRQTNGNNPIDINIEKIFELNLRNLLKKCYQCARCSGVCQLSKVQKFTPSRIIQQILEGFEDKVIKSGVLWDCLTCNSCLQNCPEQINFADIVRIARFKMRTIDKQNPDEYIAHKSIYTTISEIMSQPHIQSDRSLDWIPKEYKISNKGDILYYVGCIPFFNFEFQNLDSIAISALKIICQIEREQIVVLKEESCCGHDLYWGQGKFEAFIELAKKNINMFEKAGITTIITACAECYRTFKIDYPNIFKDFNEKFEVKHIIEYIYEKWKENKIGFKKPNKSKQIIHFTFHDPCRMSRFLPKANNLMEKTREIFHELRSLGYNFKEMVHNKENSLCCGVSSWMNCNPRTKALRYKRLLEAKAVATHLVTSCPKCIIHLSCLQEDIDEVSSIKILDFSEFLVDLINLVEPNKKLDAKK